MTSTICTTFGQTPFSYIMDYNRNSNQAGCPLPSIPRRVSSSRSAHSHSMSESSLPSFTGMHAPAVLVVHPPTPPPDLRLASVSLRTPDDRAESGSDSSLSSTQSDESQPIIIRSKRVRGQRSPPRSPPDQSTPPFIKKSTSESSNHQLPARGPVTAPPLSPGDASDNDTPRGTRPVITQKHSPSSKLGRLRLNIEPLHTRHVSESHINVSAEPQSQHYRHLPATASAIIPSAESRHVRTKSGQPIKSSLKSARRPGLTVATGNTTCKSEPNTPTHSKAVHFDAHLEHVKLFLAEQKPLAVSRDGSPTDTSGTDSEFPDFIYGKSDEERANKVLVMNVANMPKGVKGNADVALLELTLSQDMASIHGRVRVKNIAFEKWLAVRFTFDWWQTTSEVTAKYVESVEHNAFDIFAFTIRLNDIMACIEEKVLFLALRYTVAGKEIWDNNDGQNYLAKFTKSTVQPQKATPDDGVSGGKAIQHLNNKLEQVAEGRQHPSSFLAERIHREARLEAQKLPILQAEKSLSARYDLSASLKNDPWKASAPPSPPCRHRTNTFPSSPNTIPWPPKMFPMGGKRSGPEPRSPRTSALGSPGLDDSILRPLPSAASIDDTPFRLPPPSRRESRNHQRGYFDRSILDTSDLKKTPPGSPVISKRTDSSILTPLSNSNQLPRFSSFPLGDSSRLRYSNASVSPFMPAWATSYILPTGGSEDSTPSISSASSSSRSTSPSPTGEFGHPMMTDSEVPGSPNSYNGHNNYSSFLDRFCYFTGDGNSLLDISSDEIPRSHSTSSIEEFLFQSPPTNTFTADCASPLTTPTRRSPSFDEIDCRSGSSTPTARSLVTDSCSATSIMI